MQDIEKLTARQIIEYCIYHPETKRTKNMNQKLFFYFQNLNFFQNILKKEKYGNLMAWNITINLTFKLYEKGDMIWNINDIINSMFIIIEGQVKIIDFKSNKLNQRRLTITELISSIKNEKDNNINIIEKNFGNEIGENELRKKQIKRNNKVEAKVKCILGELSNTHYYLIFERTEMLEKTSIGNFLENLLLFKEYVKTYFFQKFVSSTKLIKVKRGEKIIHKGDPFKTFYIIRNGIFNLSYIIISNNLSPIDYTIIKSGRNERFTTRKNHELKQSYSEEIEYNLFKLGSGEFIGEIEYNLGMEKYYFDVKCIVDNSEIFEVDLSIFNNIVPNSLLSQFKEYSLKQLEIINERIDEIQKINENPKIKTRNKYVESFYSRFPSNKSSIDIEHNNDFYINCHKFPIKRKIKNNKIVKLKTNNLFYKSSSTSNINLKKNKNLNSIYYIPKDLKLFKNLNIPNDLTTSILFRKKKPLQNINLFLSLSSERMTNNKNKLQNSIKNSKSQKLFSTIRLMNEENKKNYSKCLEINKKLLITINPSIMGKKIEKIFMKK
jgi:CRP-like cAMP-binding protein